MISNTRPSARNRISFCREIRGRLERKAGDHERQPKELAPVDLHDDGPAEDREVGAQAQLEATGPNGDVASHDLPAHGHAIVLDRLSWRNSRLARSFGGGTTRRGRCVCPTRGRSSPAAGARAGLCASGHLARPVVSSSKVAPYKCYPTHCLRIVRSGLGLGLLIGGHSMAWGVSSLRVLTRCAGPSVNRRGMTSQTGFSPAQVLQVVLRRVEHHLCRPGTPPRAVSRAPAPGSTIQKPGTLRAPLRRTAAPAPA